MGADVMDLLWTIQIDNQFVDIMMLFMPIHGKYSLLSFS